MKKILILLIFFSTSIQIFAQNKAFDKLEMFYDQGHYRSVLRKAEKLLDDPSYDFSLLPSYYKALCLMQLASNEMWLKRNPDAIEKSNQIFLKLNTNADFQKIKDAHSIELSSFKRDLISWSEDLKRQNKQDLFETIQEFIYKHLDFINEKNQDKNIPKDEIPNEILNSNENSSIISKRENIIKEAKKHIGVPYLWAGNDPNGFDCSGFTSFVYQEIKTELPRRAEEQYLLSIKLKKEDVKKGDLIFFENGKRISHVGIVVSNKGESLKMIHASSSKGIVITDIEASDYWNKRIAGFGSYFK